MTAAADNADILRRLDSLDNGLKSLIATLDQTYVRQDVWRGAVKLATSEARQTADHVLAIANEAKRGAAEVEARVTASELRAVEADKERRSLRRVLGIALFGAFAGPIVTALIARAVS